MNPNALPFMRSLHNLSRPHQFLRNNHPVGGAPHAPHAAGIVPSAIAAPHMPRPNAAGQMAPMARGPRMHFALGGIVPSTGTLQSSPVVYNTSLANDPNLAYDPGYSDTSSDVAALQQLGNTPVVAAAVPAATNMSSVGSAPDIGAYDPTISYNNPELQQAASALSQQDLNNANADAKSGKVGGFLGQSGKDWLQIGLSALQGLTGYQPQTQKTQVGIIPTRSAQMARGGYGYAEGGRIPGYGVGRIPGYAQGGQVQAPQSPAGQDAKQIILAAAAVLAGQSNDQGAIQAFVQRFGQQELQHLAQLVQSGQLQLPGQGQQVPQGPAAAPQTPQGAMAMGGLVQGPGTGTSDSVPAVHAPTGQQINLSGGEYIVPASVVSAMGNGSTHAGAKKIAAGITSVRRKKGMPTHGNPPDLSPNSNPLFDGR